jgi:hypothetical protein
VLGERQEAAARELTQWWEGTQLRGTGSRAVLLAVPAGWGRSTVLDRLAEVIGHADSPAALMVRISGRSLAERRGPQALELRDHLMTAGVRQRAAELLCLGRLGGAARVGAAARLGASRLFTSALTATVALLRAGAAAASAAGTAGDDSTDNENTVVARAARVTAAVSASAPVAVIIDDADALDPGLAVTLIENLIDHHDSRVLVVAVVDLASGLASALTSRARDGRTAGRVHRADADPRMGYTSRADLASELCPHLPAAAVQRLARRTRTFADLFTAAGRDG